MRVVVDKVNRLFNGRVWVVRLLMAIFVMSTAVVLNGTVNAQDTFACSAGRYSCNAPESVARSRCALNEGAQGAMWFNTSDNAANESGYYSATVNVSPTSNSVRVNLRGSVNSCADASRYTAYAVNISPSGSNAARLTGLAGSVLNRGTMPGSRTTWSSQGSSLGADLNVSGLAMNNAGRTDSQTIVIGIYRCFSTNGSSPTGTCFATDVEVTVVREAGPNFNLNPSITGTPNFVEAGSATDNQISISPAVNNIGTTNSSAADWQVVTFRIAPGAGIPTGGTDNSNGVDHYGNGATVIAQGNQVFGANGITNLSAPQQSLGDLPIGTRICYGLSVHPVTHDYAGWRSSDPFCVTVGKSPKVQILGNDLMVGRLFAGATGAVPTSKIQTSVTTKAASATVIPAPQSAFTGLWKTGVNDLGQKLGQNAADPHWNLDRIVRSPGATGNTCQMAVGLNGASLVTVPTTSASPRIAPRTIAENPSGTMAGFYQVNDPAITGRPTGGTTGNQGQYVWSRVSPTARWISQNPYGQNYNKDDGSCDDPTFTDRDMNNANIYVFKLDKGFTIDPAANVDLNSARIRISGGVDNRVKFVVNGQELGDWQEPGWSPGSNATSESRGNVFKNGENSLEIWVQSTASHTGILIDDITIQANASIPNANMYGSWSEYLSTATGNIQGIGSGASYAKGVPTQTICGSSLLTLSNTANTSACSNGAVMGGYRTNRSMPAIASASVPTMSLPAVTSLSGLNGVYNAPLNMTITGGDIAPGRTVIINSPSSTITIDGDIKYSTGALTNIGQIPQVIIIAANIRVKGVAENTAVRQIDAWLIARDTINTCYDAGSIAALTINICKAPLTVNGPVMTSKLFLWRTGGSGDGAAAGDPAEVFNLRPDAYLWTISQGSKSGRLETVYERELPPRF